jgi:hypothetical protein
MISSLCPILLKLLHARPMMSSQSFADDELSYDGESRDDDESGIADEKRALPTLHRAMKMNRVTGSCAAAQHYCREYFCQAQKCSWERSPSVYIYLIYIVSRTGMISSMMTGCRCRRVSAVAVVVVVVRSGWKVQQVGMFFQYGLLDLLEGRQTVGP